MRYCSFFVHFLCLLSLSSWAQFGNEWINFNQEYYKISVVKQGIYKLTYDDLVAAGFPVGTVDPRRIQIFRRGAEQAIRFNSLQTPSNALFEQGEYFEFYGEKNDGANDVTLYKNPNHHPHPYYNLYSDTAAYFLTWNATSSILGKRMTVYDNNNNVDGLPPLSGYNSTILRVNNSEYAQGVTYAGLVHSSLFDEGEGWTGPVICTVNSGCTGQQDFSFNLAKKVTTLTAPQLELMLAGRDELSHAYEIYAGPSSASLRFITSGNFENYQTPKVPFSIQWNDVASDGSLVIRVKGLGVNGVRERFSVSYIKIDYAKNFDFTGSVSNEMRLSANGNKSYVEIQNSAAGLRLFDITDPTAIQTIRTYSQGLNVASVIQTDIARKLFATSETLSPNVKKVSFTEFHPTSNDFIIISHEALRKPGLSYSDPVLAYADYRSSTEGGAYNVILTHSSQLYNQFNYGETSSRAIYQFLKFMNAGGNTNYLFLIGKGLEINFAYDRNRVVQPSDLKDLVPTGGYPGSDLVFSTGLKGSTFEPSIPTGRLSVNNSNEVAAYLDKVKETEVLPFDALWRKQGLHLSGGIKPGEPELFKFYVDGFKTIAVEPYLGADIASRYKKPFGEETFPIANQINSGVSFVTYFGHSATNILDFDIGYVSDPTLGYNNKGKYPSFLVNGCYVGRIFDNAPPTYGENWITTKDKGAKTFIAHTSLGYEGSLRQYSDSFYRIAFNDSVMLRYGVGDIQVAVAKSMFSVWGTYLPALTVLQQMVLMGDPAIKIFGARHPDLAIQNDFLKQVSLDGDPVTSNSPAFGIQYKIRNYGQARNDSIRVKLTRTLEDNSTVEFDTIISKVYFENEFVFIVPNKSKSGGQNSFKIEVDFPDELKELNENNNTATIGFLVPTSSTFNLVPYHNSIVSGKTNELIFQNTNMTPTFRDYQLEIDTLPDFSSSFLIKKKIGAKVLGRTTITLSDSDSTTYYWRTKLDKPINNESSDWFTSSFNYIKSSEKGWSQLSTTQISSSELVKLEINNTTGEFNFPGASSNIYVQNFGSTNPNLYTSTSIKINNEEFNLRTQGQPCRQNTICIVAFDKTTGSPYAPIPLIFLDARTCGREPQVINNFTLAEAESLNNGLAQAITNIQQGDSVILFTISDAGVQNWSPTLLSKLQELGISSGQLNNYQAGEPMIIFARKSSAAGTAKVVRASVAPLNAQELVVNETITSRPSVGSIKSREIGPSRFWDKVFWKVDEVEATDQLLVKVIGVSKTSGDVVLYSGTDSPINISFIDPGQYPLIKLEIQFQDNVNLTPARLKNWSVTYKPVAEGIMLIRESIEPISLFEGQTWSGKYAYINLTKEDFIFDTKGDSIQSVLNVDNSSKGNVELTTTKRKSPSPLDSIVYNLSVKTIGKSGLNDIDFTVNTDLVPEQYPFNNSFSLSNYLNVIPDQQPPILDVIVDGRYLENGDNVSLNPIVNIKMMDDNVYLFKTDTVGMDIVVTNITNINKQTSSRINFSSSSVSWSPASLQSDFLINFSLALTPGEYELSIQAVDASGNKSGQTPHTVTFVVSDETNVFLGSPFPNPSSSAISFPVKISGNEIPDSFTLKVFGTNGRLAKQFNVSDVSSFYIGSNYLKWDGTDNNGSELPTGLYFYTMDLAISGKVYSKSGRVILVKP